MATIDRIRQRMAAELQPDEKVLYGTFGMRTGGVRKAMIGGALGIAGGVGAAAMAAATKSGPQVPATTLTLPSRFFVVLTDQRLLVFSTGGAIVAKPKNVLYTYSRDQLAWVSDELIPGVAQAFRVSLGITDAGVLNFEFPRLEVSAARTMVSRIRKDMPAAQQVIDEERE